MKRTIIGILLVLLLANCQRNEPQNLLVGTWRWEQSSGGDSAYVVVEPKQGENTYLTFLNNQTFEITRNDTLFVTGKYRITRVKSAFSNKIVEAIKFQEMVTLHQGTGYGEYFYFLGDLRIIKEITSSVLSLSANYVYGYGSSFTRK